MKPQDWIVKNKPQEPPVKKFEDRIAAQQEIAEAASTEQLEEWLANKKALWAEGKHDLVQAARIEFRKRQGEEPDTNYSGAWIR